MGQTTIQISEALRDDLLDARKPHESNYGQTIARLLNNDSGGQLWTEAEIEDIAHRVIAEEMEGRMR